MQLTCPECSKVLRPAKPLAAGKKVKCPNCATIFAVTEDDLDEPRDDEIQPTPVKKKPSPAAPARKPPPKAPAPSSDDDDDEYGGGTYSVAGGDEPAPEEEDEDKPKITYAPDTSIKDLRGPAQAALMKPTSRILTLGVSGFIGWLVFMILFLIPVLFPLESDEGTKENLKSVLKIGKGLGKAGNQIFVSRASTQAPKDDDDGPSTYTILVAFFTKLAAFPWYVIILFILPHLMGMAYAGVQTYGAVKAQNMQSRGWGIAASVMSFLPFGLSGASIFFVLVHYGLLAFLGLYIFQVIWGIRLLTTLNREEVIAGFEYVPDSEDVQAVKTEKPRRRRQR